MSSSNTRLLGGRYELRSLIGRGGMATVHLGRDTRLSRLVAIKMLRMDLARDAIFQTRFRREAQAAASLNQPNIVAVYDTGEEATKASDGQTVMVPYIVMEYVEGHTVKELLSDGTPVPIPEAVEITEGVLAALAYSHAAGLVHRDIKPGNIMLTNSGKVKVMDFGIARAMADSQATMTSANAVVGTALYLSPEQARGERIDERSDVYSAGCVLFELLTGRAPFAGDSAVSLAYQHVSEPPPLPSSIASDVPEALDRVVLKALAKDPSERYASASDMAVDLSRAAEGLPVQAPTVQAWEALDTTAATQVVQSVGTATETMAYPGPSRVAAQAAATQASTGAIPVQGPRKKSKATAIWLWVLIILALAMVAAVIWVFLSSGNSEDQPEMTAVPRGLVGLTQTEAKGIIEEEGLVFVLGDPVASDTIEEGLVAEVEPHEGTPLETGSEVLVQLSAGPSSAEVPPVSGQSLTDAESALTAAGFVLGEVRMEDDATVAEGKVIRSVPQAGSIQPKGSKVELVVSSGMVGVPIVTGMTESDAVSRLSALTLRTTVTQQYSDTVPAGAVISQSLGGRQPQGTTVSLVISKGPEPAPEPPPAPEPEPEPGEGGGEGEGEDS